MLLFICLVLERFITDSEIKLHRKLREFYKKEGLW
jgi:hypothetical protein